MKDVFVVVCVSPTSTLTKGKEYTVIDSTNGEIAVINDNGNKCRFLANRFSEIKIKEEKENDKLTVTCVNAGNFRNLKVGKKYKVEKETKDYYYVLNSRGKKIRYGKKYFMPSTQKDKDTVKRKLEKPKPTAECIYPIANEITYKKVYDFTVYEKDDRYIVLTNDKGTKKTYLKKRFKING